VRELRPPYETPMTVPLTWHVVRTRAPGRSVVPIEKCSAGNPPTMSMVPGSDFPFELLVQLVTLFALVS
jgi:hypothetical protein